MSIRQNQVEEVVSRFGIDQLDLLMKFVYRGFESPAEGSSGN
jgi:actin related protein 2/3 complex subunit 5